jgi:tRNA(Arg) A34 adenosine deaminase TadA
MTLEELEARLDAVAAERTSRPDQPLGIVTCREALAAARTGNFGVGAALVDPRGTVVEQGRNALFYPRFRSDLHAEMVVMSAFEDRNPAGDSMRGYTLVCSLEPCPMCVARLLIAGVQTVNFLAPDELGGMAGPGAPTTAMRVSRRWYVVCGSAEESASTVGRHSVRGSARD